MVGFSVFNEKSLAFQNNINIEEKFIDFFKLLKELENRNLTKIRMDKNFINYPEIIENITLQQFFGQLKNTIMKDRLREFISNGIVKIESPLIKEEETEERNQFLENEYFYRKESTVGGLACCDIWNTIAISFNSKEEWNREIITLEKQGILDDKEISINIRHSTKVEHLDYHKVFFDNLEEEKRLDMKQETFWNKREEFFPKKIVFCKEVEKQIKNIDKVVFEQAMSILRDVETDKKKIRDYNYSPESESVCNDKKLATLRIFTYKNIKIQFNNHVKSLSSANRIYFLEHKKKIYIGYIGKHLPTKKFK